MRSLNQETLTFLKTYVVALPRALSDTACLNNLLLLNRVTIVENGLVRLDCVYFLRILLLQVSHLIKCG